MMKSNNFGLSQIEFEELVEALRKGDESIFEKIFLSQFSNAIKHVRIKYSASNEEAYDMTMDALIKIRKLLIEGKLKYGNLKHLFNRMAGQNYLKLKNRGKKIVLQDTLPEVAIEPADLNEEEMNITVAISS